MNMAWYFNEIASSDFWGPTISGVGIYELPKQKMPVPLLLNARILDTYALVFLIGGQGRFKSSCGGEHAVHAGNVFWLFPGEPHKYGAEIGDSWNERWMLLSGKWMNRLEKEKIIKRNSPIWSVGLPIDAQEEFSKLFELCRKNPPMLANRISASAAKVIFHLHMAKLFPDTQDETMKMMNTARQKIVELIEATVSVERISEELGVSVVHFRRLFRQTFGQPVGQYILDTKISKAQQLLSAGMSIKTVAKHLNFANVYYFTRIFKKKTSLPPRQWISSRTYKIPEINTADHSSKSSAEQMTT